MAGFRRLTRRTISRPRACSPVFFEVNAVYRISAISASEIQRASSWSQTASRYLIGFQAVSGMAAIVARMVFVLATVIEWWAPAARIALTSLAEKNAESARTRIIAVTPASRSARIASATSESAPLPVCRPTTRREARKPWPQHRPDGPPAVRPTSRKRSHPASPVHQDHTLPIAQNIYRPHL